MCRGTRGNDNIGVRRAVCKGKKPSGVGGRCGRIREGPAQWWLGSRLASLGQRYIARCCCVCCGCCGCCQRRCCRSMGRRAIYRGAAEQRTPRGHVFFQGPSRITTRPAGRVQEVLEISRIWLGRVGSGRVGSDQEILKTDLTRPP